MIDVRGVTIAIINADSVVLNIILALMGRFIKLVLTFVLFAIAWILLRKSLKSFAFLKHLQQGLIIL